VSLISSLCVSKLELPLGSGGRVCMLDGHVTCSAKVCGSNPSLCNVILQALSENFTKSNRARTGLGLSSDKKKIYLGNLSELSPLGLARTARSPCGVRSDYVGDSEVLRQ
jgi:hypothetical protein